MTDQRTVDQLAATVLENHAHVARGCRAGTSHNPAVYTSAIKEAVAVLAARATQAEAEAELKRIETHHANAKRRDAEAEAARLREQLDAANAKHRRWMERHDAMEDRAEAAEARCAQLEQALTRIDEWTYYGHLNDDMAATLRDIKAVAREALAGPDTPADSQPRERIEEVAVYVDGQPIGKTFRVVPADGQPKDTA